MPQKMYAKLMICFSANRDKIFFGFKTSL